MNRFLIPGQIHKGLLLSYYSERHNKLTFTKIVIADEVNQSLEIDNHFAPRNAHFFGPFTIVESPTHSIVKKSRLLAKLCLPILFPLQKSEALLWAYPVSRQLLPECEPMNTD